MIRPLQAELEILADREALARRVARWLSERAAAKKGIFALALSGGSTPRRLYELLAEPPYRDALPWERVHWFWGDERFVSANDARSNYHMVREALLSRTPVPAANVHAIPTQGMTVDEAAANYQNVLEAFYGAAQLDPAKPLFDITLLGLGTDGHTASLFPGTRVLMERRRWVAAVTDAAPELRITLTYPALESSAHTVFLVAGPEKREIFMRLRRGDEALPASRLRPFGSLHYFADAAAAGETA